MRREKRWFLVLAFLLVGCGHRPAPAKPRTALLESPISGLDLYRQMRATYAKMESYVDSGVLVSTDFDRGEISATTMHFRFEVVRRPSQLRFEFTDESFLDEQRDGFMVVTPEHVWCALPHDRTEASGAAAAMDEAIYRFQGVTSGVLVRMWRWFSGVRAPGCTSSEPLVTSLGDELVGRRRCRRLRLQYEDATSEMWIDDETQLVRKIFERHRIVETRAERDANLARLRTTAPEVYERESRRDRPLSDFDVEETVLFEPEPNAVIAPERFLPPAGREP